ncbi:MAG: S41 family peptidase [bacterium]
MKKQTRKQTFIGILIIVPILFLSTASIRMYNSNKSLLEQIKLFSAIFDRINRDYVEEKDPEKLLDDAIKGMVSGLDPHTAYLAADYFKQWSERYEGYSGIGVTFDIVRDKITVMSVITGGPSEKVGLRPGDRIVAINGEAAIGMKRDEVPLKLMGPRGTKVEISIERSGWPESKPFAIIRDEVHLESIPYAFMIKPDVGYIGIVRFSSTTGDELEKNLQSLKAQGMKQLILDLRYNGGGYLEAAVEVADKFIPRGKRIVYTQGRIREAFREFFSTDRATEPGLPFVVLINRISASASEIVAGAMQDWDRALILGETSFGKGLVQTQYRFNDGSALLMTTARYYTPSGRLIQRPYDEKSLEEYYEEIDNDSLRRAWERDPSRPSYRTLILRRKVYGGGGITPDVFLTSERDTVSAVMLNMVNSSERLFFTFAEDYVKNHPELRGDFNKFLRNYTPDGNTIQQFLRYMGELGFKMTTKEFIDNKKDIQFFLKQSIAAEIWGDEARYKVQMLRDRQLVEALGYLSESEKLLSQAYHIR